MRKKNQILLIKDFINSKDETILINQVNEELGTFYLSIIKHYAYKENIKINFNNSESMGVEDDLFGHKEIEILSITNTKKLTEKLNKSNKKIIFTDYKNYKKLYSEYNCVNGYQFELDIIFFIRDELKIDDDELLNYCKNNPVLLFSEISKYLINDKYSSDQALVEEKNHILNIRKSIFEIKKNKSNIKDLYLNLKKEVEYKKLSFLIY